MMRIGMAAYLNGNLVGHGGKTIAMTTQQFAATPDLAATADIRDVATSGNILDHDNLTILGKLIILRNINRVYLYTTIS